MPKFCLRVFVLGFVLCPVAGWAQVPGFAQIQGDKVDADVALDRALKRSSLTVDGKPFHAVMEVGTAGTDYSGQVEVWWVNATKYRLKVTSPKFSQEKVVNAAQVQEMNEGDYYPRWLENFVLAILDPVPMAENFRGRSGAVMLGEHINRSCIQRDDRPGGITDQLTWGSVCFSGSEPHLGSVQTMNIYMEYTDWKGFGKKQVARTYSTDVLDYKPVVGRLTTLEELKKPDEAMFAVSAATPVDEQIATIFVSTLKEESLIDTAPQIQWPSVREGKTEGYMIVYARTDRTGQVRETAKHNSDQAGLESFGMEQALKYKFKPLVVDGVAQQMEMPLVLHFTSRLDNPLPILTAEQMKKQMISCKLASIPPGVVARGTVLTIRVSVDETGSVAGAQPLGSAPWGRLVSVWGSIRGACKFSPYVVDGQATYYKGDIEVVAP